MMNQVLLQFGDIEPFLQRNEDVGASTQAKMLEILSNHPKLIALKMELACVVDVGVYFVNGTYRLEGHGVLVLNCYEEILKIRNAIRTGHYPNLQALTRQAFPGNSGLQQQWMTYAISCEQPGLDYFQSKLGSDDLRQPDCSHLTKPIRYNLLQQVLMTSRLSLFWTMRLIN